MLWGAMEALALPSGEPAAGDVGDLQPPSASSLDPLQIHTVTLPAALSQ